MPYPGWDTENEPGSGIRERRSVQRLALDAEVSIAGDSQFFTGRVANVSACGVFVSTERHLALGSPVVMQIALPDGEVFAKGHVRWIRDPAGDGAGGLGIEFESPLPEPYAQRVSHFARRVSVDVEQLSGSAAAGGSRSR